MEGSGLPQSAEVSPHQDFLEAVFDGFWSQYDNSATHYTKTVDDIQEFLKTIEDFTDCFIFPGILESPVGKHALIICPDQKVLIISEVKGEDY